METKDINKVWTIKNGEAAKTWVNLSDLVNYIDEKVKGYDKKADELIEQDDWESGLCQRDRADALRDLWFELLKELE